MVDLVNVKSLTLNMALFFFAQIKFGITLTNKISDKLVDACYYVIILYRLILREELYGR